VRVIKMLARVRLRSTRCRARFILAVRETAERAGIFGETSSVVVRALIF
jgi:hypothetical protein